MLFVIVCSSDAQISDFNAINFKKADSIALAYNDEALSNLPQLAYNLTSHLDTDVERFRAIYFWVCHNISNNYGLYLKNKHKRHRFKNNNIKLKAWNDDFKKTLFKKLLKNKTTICTGYAYLVRELAQLANLECEIVQGYGRVSTTDIENIELPNHSWNAIKIDDKWYLCDPTWASGIPNPKTNRFTFQYNDGFFLAEPELFAVNHFPLEEKWWLLDKARPNFEKFLAAPILYGNAYKNLILHNAPNKMHHTIKRKESIVFSYQFKDELKREDLTFLIDNGNFSKEIKPSSVDINNTSLTIKQRFESKGFFDVHLYFRSELIATYTVKVN